jgi:hypothetical protein
MMARGNSAEKGDKTITERQKIEYDAFGPWVYEVKTAMEMPGRFDPWYAEFSASRLILKIPRPVDRRDAIPGSDLYLTVLAIGGDSLTQLSLEGTEVKRLDIPFSRIVAVRRILELLSGRLCLDLSDSGSVELPFNAVSTPLMDRFAAELLKSCGTERPGWRVTQADLVGGPGGTDPFFLNLLCNLRRAFPGLALLAYQQPCSLRAKANAKPSLARLMAGLRHWRLDSCILAQTACGLIAIRESSEARSRKAKGYRYETIYLPAASFRGASLEPRPVANGAQPQALRLYVAGHGYDLLFEREPPACLGALAASHNAGRE